MSNVLLRQTPKPEYRMPDAYRFKAGDQVVVVNHQTGKVSGESGLWILTYPLEWNWTDKHRHPIGSVHEVSRVNPYDGNLLLVGHDKWLNVHSFVLLEEHMT